MKFIIRKKQENVYEFVRILDTNEEYLIMTDELKYCLQSFFKSGVPRENLEIID